MTFSATARIVPVLLAFGSVAMSLAELAVRVEPKKRELEEVNLRVSLEVTKVVVVKPWIWMEADAIGEMLRIWDDTDVNKTPKD